EFLLPQIFDASGILVDDVSPNVWIDILAAQRVFAAGIRHIVIMPIATQQAVPWELSI
ncbi:unnamed protein product, partial [Didymodactylos carnosus]